MSKKKKQVNILICGNKKVFDGILTGLISILNRTNAIIKLYDKEFKNCPNEKAYCTPYTLIRLFADLVPDIPDKILYLDTDIMVNDDILKLFNIDIKGYEYAAVKEKYGCWLIRPDYINAGMLLMNKKNKTPKKRKRYVKKEKTYFCRSRCHLLEYYQKETSS